MEKAKTVLLLREHAVLIRDYLAERPIRECVGAFGWLVDAINAADAQTNGVENQGEDPGKEVE